MTQFTRVTDQFSVSPQIAVGDMAVAAAEGFALVINNRPDGEVPGQPSNAQMEAAARGAGLDYRFIPVVGRPSPDQARAVHDAVAKASGPVLAFCRSGNRSILAWTMGQAAAGERTRDELIRLGADAGYDVSAVLSG